MCYSAMVAQYEKSLGLHFPVRVDLKLTESQFRARMDDDKVRIRKGFEARFAHPKDEQERRIHELIEQYNSKKLAEEQEELFSQKRRLADAERKLRTKPTKTAEKERGIAERNVGRLLSRIERRQATSLAPEDERIFAMDYAPVIMKEGDEYVARLMRYHLRPQGYPETFDRQYPGCYNARRDNLENFWKGQFGKKHALLVASSFFENVKRHDFEQRALKPGEKEENLVLQFKARGHGHMLIPCLYDVWRQPGKPDLWSFALITDEPPKEISDAGHDRCPIFLKEKYLDLWLQPQGHSIKDFYAAFDDRERPFYEHALVA